MSIVRSVQCLSFGEVEAELAR